MTANIEFNAFSENNVRKILASTTNELMFMQLDASEVVVNQTHGW